MKYEKLDAAIDDLLLDLDNPRTGHVASQAEALAAVIKLSGRNFRNMMKSIKDHGLDPGDAFYLIQEDDEEDGFFTVVDGNRRLAALKVLNNPLLLKGTNLPETITKPLTKEAEGWAFDADFTVDCVLFADRSDAADWIERRHGRGMDGEGRIQWGTLEIQRFQNDRTVIDVIEFVERNSTFSDPDWARIKAAVEKNTSSLKRFLEGKAGRQHLGFAIAAKGDGPTFTLNENYIIDILSQIFSDISDGEINTRSYNKASDIEEYFDSVKPTIKSKPGKAGAAKPFATTRVTGGKERPRLNPRPAAAPAAAAPKVKKVAAPRVTLAPARISFAAPEGEKGKQLLREAAKLRLKVTPLACAFCFRSLVEYSVDTYMRANKIPPNEAGVELHLVTRIERVIKHIYDNDRAHKGDLAAIKTTLTGKNGSMSIGALNGYVHHKFQMPTADDLRVAWEHAVPFFTAIYGPAK